MHKHLRRTEYWATRDLYLAAFLFARGIPVIGVESCRGGLVFKFVDSADRQNWFDEFKSGKPLVDARIYAVALSTLQTHACNALLNQDARV